MTDTAPEQGTTADPSTDPAANGEEFTVTETITDDVVVSKRPVTVSNVTPGAKSGLDHQVIGSAAQDAFDATNPAEPEGDTTPDEPDEEQTGEATGVPTGEGTPAPADGTPATLDTGELTDTEQEADANAALGGDAETPDPASVGDADAADPGTPDAPADPASGTEGSDPVPAEVPNPPVTTSEPEPTAPADPVTSEAPAAGSGDSPA